MLAENEEEAKIIHPSGSIYHTYFKDINRWCSEVDYKRHKEKLDYCPYLDDRWCKSPEVVTVQYIGEFKGNIEDYPTRIVCSSFNAG